MTKFYCLLLDCTPVLPCITDIGKKYNFTFLHHLSGGSTTFTMFPILTGCVPSDIIKNGVGYLSFGDGDALQKHANEDAISAYNERNGYFDDWKWLQNRDTSLFHI